MYLQCLKVDPNNFQSKVNLAIILEKEGQIDQAF